MASRFFTWPPPRKTPWQQFRDEPAIFLARWFHQRRPTMTSRQPSDTHPKDTITAVCISDTHMSHPHVPDGDVLFHAGDLTNHGTFEELQAQLDWLASMPHRYKVVIGGNHDSLLDADYVARFPDRICETEGKSRSDLQWHDLIYLDKASTTLTFYGKRKLKVFGSAWTPQYGTFAFQYPPIRDVWNGAIPAGTDVLLTHGPPKGYLDLEGKGCPHLMREVGKLRPRVAVFGHIHAGHGQEQVTFGGVERCYHKIISGDGGLLTVFGMMGWFLITWIKALMPSPLRPGGDRTQRTTMVNAAMGETIDGNPRQATILTI